MKKLEKLENPQNSPKLPNSFRKTPSLLQYTQTMSGKKQIIDPVELASKATQHEIRVQPIQQEMALARTNSNTAHELADGVKEYKGAKITAHQREAMDESLPHISKMANTTAIKSSGRIQDMAKAEKNSETAKALVGEVREYKGAKIEAHQREAMDESLPHISKMANTTAIKSSGRVQDMANAEKNSETAKALVEGVQEYKGAKTEAHQRENKAVLNKEISKE
jgi:ribosomal protein S10